MCDIDDGEHASVWSVREVGAARKRRRCNACGAEIRVGDAYVSVFMIHDREPVSEAACSACWAIAKEFGDEHRFTPSPAYLYECVAGCAEDGDRWDRAAAEIRARSALVGRASRAVRAVLWNIAPAEDVQAP